MRAEITTIQSLGQSQYEYEITAWANVEKDETGSYSFSNSDMDIVRNGKILTGKRYQIAVGYVNTDDLDTLLIEEVR